MGRNIVKKTQDNFGAIFDNLMNGGYYYLRHDEAFTNLTGKDLEIIQLDPHVWRKEMTNCATAYYLNVWLCYDLNSRVNIFQYIDNLFGKSEDRQRTEKEERAVRQARKHFYSSRAKYLEVITAMKHKEKEEGFAYYDLMYSLRSDSKELKEYSPYDEEVPDAYKTAWLSPVALELIKWMNAGKFQFINLLFYKNSFQKGHNDKLSIRQLKRAYANYFQAIRSLKESRDPKEYVLGAFLLQQYEPIFEHMIAACLAVCKEGFPFKVPMKFFRLATSPWWSCEVLQYKNDRGKTKRKLYFKTTGDYVNLMKAARAFRFFLPKSMDWGQNHYMKKVILNDMLNFQFGVNEGGQLTFLGDVTEYPVKYNNPFESDIDARKVFFENVFPKWTDDDYVCVRDFLRNDYPIIENHISFYLGDPMEWTDSMVESIQDYYDPLFCDCFGYVRCEIAEKKKRKEIVCPKCHKKTTLVKSGFTPTHVQRYICDRCGKTYTLEPKKKRYSESIKDRATGMFNEGMTVRKIAKTLGCSKSSVQNWVSKETHKDVLKTPH